MVETKEDSPGSPFGIHVAIFVSMMVIVLVIGYMVMDIGDSRVDKITDQMLDEIEDADCSSDFYDGWVAAVKHFRVLWNNVENATGV